MPDPEKHLTGLLESERRIYGIPEENVNRVFRFSLSKIIFPSIYFSKRSQDDPTEHYLVNLVEYNLICKHTDITEENTLFLFITAN